MIITKHNTSEYMYEIISSLCFHFGIKNQYTDVTSAYFDNMCIDGEYNLKTKEYEFVFKDFTPPTKEEDRSHGFTTRQIKILENKYEEVKEANKIADIKRMRLEGAKEIIDAISFYVNTLRTFKDDVIDLKLWYREDDDDVRCLRFYEGASIYLNGNIRVFSYEKDKDVTVYHHGQWENHFLQKYRDDLLKYKEEQKRREEEDALLRKQRLSQRKLEEYQRDMSNYSSIDDSSFFKRR